MTETEAAVMEILAVATAARARETRLWRQIRLLRLSVLLLLATLAGVSAGFVWQREVAREALRNNVRADREQDAIRAKLIEQMTEMTVMKDRAKEMRDLIQGYQCRHPDLKRIAFVEVSEKPSGSKTTVYYLNTFHGPASSTTEECECADAPRGE